MVGFCMLKFPNIAVDSEGDTIEFMLSENRDAKSAERFFEKALKFPHSVDPRVINVDKNAAYPSAMAALKEDGLVEKACKLCQVKYLNNIVEQDHRFIKRRVAPALGFASFHTADRTLRGYEAMNMIRKGQIQGVDKKDITGQVKFIENLFGIAA
jgi:IS6 family transposase